MASYGAASSAFRSLLLGSFFLARPAPTQLFVAVTIGGVAPPGVTDTSMVEPVDTIYERQPYTIDADSWEFVDDAAVANSAPILWSTPNVDWGQLSGWALTDLPVGGQVYASGQLVPSIYMSAGAPPLQIDPLGLVIALL